MISIIGLAALARSGKDTVASLLLEHKEVAAYALADPLKAGCQALFGLTSEETWDDTIKEEVISLWSLSPRQMFQRVGTEWMRNHNPEHWLMRADKEINHSSGQAKPFASPDNLAQSDAPIRLASQAFFGLTNEQTWSDQSLHTQDEYWGITPFEIFSLIESLCHNDFENYEQQRNARPVQVLESKQLSLAGKQFIIIKDIRYENEADFWRMHGGVIWHIQRANAEKVNAHSSELGIKFDKSDISINNNGTLEELKSKVNKAWLTHTASVSP